MRKMVFCLVVIVIATATGKAQTTSARTQLAAQTAAECLTTVSNHARKKAEAARKAGEKPNYRQYQEEATALAQKCAAQFDLTKVKDAELIALAKLYAEAKRYDLARSAIEHRLASAGLGSNDRAETLLAGVEVSITSKPTEEDLNQAERYAAQLDAIRDAPITQKIQAHLRLGSYYNYADRDAKNLEHHEQIVALINQLGAEEKKNQANTKSSAYQSIALVHANRGMPDKAIEALKQGRAELADTPRAAQWLAQAIQRYSLIGQPGAPIKATYWINSNSSGKQLDLRGKVTLLEFTAHWCIPCRNSYPAILKFHDQFAKRGLETVFVTQLYGFFDKQEDLKPEDELAADREYYVNHHQVPFKIAIESRPINSENGSPDVREDNEARYFVGGIPQIMLLDKQGIVRLVMVGWDPANEAKMMQMIEKLLSESPADVKLESQK